MKKLTKILSAIALCGAGAVTLAGCTDINLSQSQVDKIVTVVDNSDQFMKDTMDLLNKQNKKLDKSEAYDLLKTVGAKAKLNINGYWDNVRVIRSSTPAYGLCGTFEMIKYDDNHFATVTYLDSEEELWGISYDYTKNDGDVETEKMVEYSTFSLMSGKLDNPSLIERDYKYSETVLANFVHYSALVDELDIKEEDITNVVINENGNYVLNIVAVHDDGDTEWQNFYTIEIDNDARLVSLESSTAEFEKSSGNRTSTISIESLKFEYGVANAENVKAKMKIAEEFAKTLA